MWGVFGFFAVCGVGFFVVSVCYGGLQRGARRFVDEVSRPGFMSGAERTEVDAFGAGRSCYYDGEVAVVGPPSLVPRWTSPAKGARVRGEKSKVGDEADGEELEELDVFGGAFCFVEADEQYEEVCVNA